MLYSTVLFIDKVNKVAFIYYTKDYVTACNFISQKKRGLQDVWIEGKDYTISHGSEIELSEDFIEKDCIYIQPGVYHLLY